MRRSFMSQAWVAGLLVTMGCAETPVEPPQLEANLSRGEIGSQVAEVFAFGDPPTLVDGRSLVRRGERGVRARIQTRQLAPRHTYTAWLVIFNNPTECVEGCGEDDLFNPDALVDVVYLAGRISDRRGRVTLAGHRLVRDKSGSLFAALGAPAPGLVDPYGAEVHVVVRDHGPPVRGQVQEQLRTFEGGCTPETSFDLGGGSYPCADVQFAIHLP